MFADRGAALVDDRARLDALAEAVLQQGPVAAIRHEADLLTLRLECCAQAKVRRLFADPSFRPVADRKTQDRQLILAQLV